MVTERTVLIVDDDVGMAETLADILEARRHRVVAVHSGGSAVAAAQESAFDTVLMDIQMPGMNGVEALQAIKETSPATQVILMTAFTRHELVEEARRARAAAVLFKPLDMDQVLELIG
jgi:DNA-binding NtrC family response regulator